VQPTPLFDHIALTVPKLEEQVERLRTSFGMEVQTKFDGFAVLVDPATGIRFELGASPDEEVHVRHLGFRAFDVDAAHESLVDAGMETARAPQRQDFAAMYTSYLSQPGGVEVQLVKYDD
jgi:catechol 2,3-dioxygenase-like lactoylglutathione lyase family enzyme